MSDIKTNTFLSHDWKDRVTELFFSCYLLLFQSETQITRLARNNRSTRNWWSVKYIFIMSRMQITYKGWRSKERKMFWLKKKTFENLVRGQKTVVLASACGIVQNGFLYPFCLVGNSSIYMYISELYKTIIILWSPRMGKFSSGRSCYFRFVVAVVGKQLRLIDPTIYVFVFSKVLAFKTHGWVILLRKQSNYTRLKTTQAWTIY